MACCCELEEHAYDMINPCHQIQGNAYDMLIPPKKGLRPILSGWKRSDVQLSHQTSLLVQ